MPRQNRVAPDGSIHSVAARGDMFGNRGGCFHFDDGTLKPKRWANRQWICCELRFKGRRRRMMQPGLYTELFFLDEATALAAGHRPCFECRRADAVRFQALWADVHRLQALPKVAEMDAVLHRERRASATAAVRPHMPRADAPVGSMLDLVDGPVLVAHDGLRPWRFDGYGSRFDIPPATDVTLITPPAIVAIIRAGYVPRLHASALPTEIP